MLSADDYEICKPEGNHGNADGLSHLLHRGAYPWRNLPTIEQIGQYTS